MKNPLKPIRELIAGILDTKIDAKTKLVLTDANIEKIDTTAKMKGFAVKYMNDHNAAIEAKEADDKIKKFMAEQNIDSAPEANSAKPSQDDGEANAGETTPQTSATAEVPSLDQLIAQTKLIIAENKELKDKITALSDKPEPDVPLAIIGANKNQPMKTIIAAHSATALHASNEPFRLLAQRPWNANAVAIDQAGNLDDFKATTWDSITIDKINADFGAYSRVESDRIVDIFRDHLELPSNWDVVSGISDQIVYAKILTGEITQGRKKGWKPKNKVEFKPVKGKVYDIQIDMTWTGAELQDLEKSWLKTRLLDDNGSNPYKMDFVQFLVEHLLKKARYEDKLGLIKGVFYPNDKLVQPGKAINAQSGLFKLIESKKGIEYNPFILSFPKPTAANILDYHREMCESLPESRKNTLLKFYLSPFWMRKVKDALRFRDGTNTDYTGPLAHVEGFANIEYYELKQFEGSDLFVITLPENMGVLVDGPEENSLVTFEKAKRDINGIADYKIGMHVWAFGAEMDSDTVSGFDNQIFWTNDVELLTDVYVPVDANNTTPTLEYHNALIIGEENTAPTDITNFLKAPKAGTKIYLKGNSTTNLSTVKNNTNIILANGDAVLTNTTILVLVARNDGKFVELERSVVTPASDDITILADATTFEIGDGTRYITSANTKATALTNITGASNGVIYRITGGSDAQATTIANAGNFQLASAFTATTGAYIELIFNGTKFIEVNRG